jgi:hypothetical protein
VVKLSFDAERGVLSAGALDRWLNIPSAMRERRQWAVSTLALGPDGKPDKRPRRADGSEMEWRNPLEWLTFEQAASAGYPAIGFILTNADPFVVIDLDIKDASNEPDPEKWTTGDQRDRQAKVYQAFPSYSELSQSGKGLHIILTGQIGGGVNRDRIEVYDQDRYMLCTGDVVTPGPVQSHPEMLERLIEEMGGVASTRELPPSEAEPAADDELLRRMENARNGDKFKRLFYGPVEMGSENDLSLLTMMAFFTRNHDQLLRLFARSVLYRPRGEADGKKGHSAATYHQKYLVETLGKALAMRDDAQPSADLEHGRALAMQLLARPIPTEAPPVPQDEHDFPPGLVGDVARYIYHASPYPGKPVSIAGALAFMAGIFGRQYNISRGAGLNLYIALLAPSGSGKDHARVGMNALFGHLAKDLPGVLVYKGPEVISSTGLRKALGDQNPCMISQLGEIGTLLRAMLSNRPSENDQRLKRALLEIYTSATRGGGLQATGHSKAEDRAQAVDFPAFTIFGESTQTEFYKAVGADSFADGLIPRFLPIIYTPPMEDNFNRHMTTYPDGAFLQRLSGMVAYVMQLQTLGDTGFVEIEVTCPVEADAMRAAYLMQSRNPELDENDPERLMASRAYLQVMKVAGLVAVGKAHPGEVPKVGVQDLLWAKKLVDAGIQEIIRRRDKGDFVAPEARKVPAIEDAIRKYFATTDKAKAGTWKVPQALIGKPLIPYTYFRRKLGDQSVFQNDPRGLAAAVKQAIQDAIDIGLLQRLTDAQKQQEAGRVLNGEVYCLGPGWQG